MDIEKLIEQLNDFNENHIAVLCGSGQCACGYLCDKDDCIVVRATAALSTLQAENEKLREKIEDARLEGYAKGLGEMSEENEKLRAELERMKGIMRYNGIMVIPSKYPGGRSEWNIPKPRGQKED